MTLLIYAVIFIVLVGAELAYFRIADKYNIIDKPNERSSHSTIVLRGGGVLFTFAVVVWAVYQLLFGVHSEMTGMDVVLGYLPFVIGLLMIATVSFVDDVVGTSNRVRLVVQFVSAVLLMCCLVTNSGFFNLGSLAHDAPWQTILVVVPSVVACVGIMNVYNFMDGINGITGGYSLAVFVSLFLLNEYVLPERFIVPSLLACELLAVLIFCFFNFRPKGKAKCFAGDVGSVTMAFVLLFALVRLIALTGDVTWIVFLVVYGVDGCLTIVHRIMLHEHLGEAHRKHAYQLMANELKISPITISTLYTVMQLVINLLMIYVVPNNAVAHWFYFVGIIVVLSGAYVLFMKKYYHLHAEYLASLKQKG